MLWYPVELFYFYLIPCNTFLSKLFHLIYFHKEQFGLLPSHCPKWSENRTFNTSCAFSIPTLCMNASFRSNKIYVYLMSSKWYFLHTQISHRSPWAFCVCKISMVNVTYYRHILTERFGILSCRTVYCNNRNNNVEFSRSYTKIFGCILPLNMKWIVFLQVS